MGTEHILGGNIKLGGKVMKYDYFISYNYIGDKESGVGNSIVKTNYKITSLLHIRDVEKAIKEKNNNSLVIISNYKLLKRYLF